MDEKATYRSQKNGCPWTVPTCVTGKSVRSGGSAGCRGHEGKRLIYALRCPSRQDHGDRVPERVFVEPWDKIRSSNACYSDSAQPCEDAQCHTTGPAFITTAV